MRHPLTALAPCLVLALSACGGGSRLAPAPGSPSDPEILAVMEALCMAEVMEGGPAQEQAAASAVAAFGNRIVDDGTVSLKDLQGLRGIDPLPNDTSKFIEAEAKQTIDVLGVLQGPDFDREFMDHEIAAYGARIKLMQFGLLPYTDNGSLATEIRVQLVQAQDHLLGAIDVRRNDVK